MGVFELADSTERVVYIGTAGANSRFGLQGELRSSLGLAAMFRYEVTTVYLTRQRELLMVYYADHGAYPERHSLEELRNLGRLSLRERRRES